ncbi:hypothetical protein Ddye_013566 [Dipteronia dyeriana]|uniref:Protein kinase domain-containing protein n=1 Tax=Dipteronia dyeriana TaxID=168575 RepID=A0AAE0CJR4_9ROSI|nr:hypothetical protein Ddye_013566 [Dipteronia dyeriana]
MGWNCFCCVKDKEKQEISQVYLTKDYPWEIYSLKELLHATNNFHNDNKIGEGGFGSVYWGRTTKGTEIAVKRLKTMSAKAEMEFAVEVEILGRVRHKNLLGLRGFYAGGDERLIVYDYMPNHSLITHLHGHLASDCLLDWRRRMSIIIGSAEGLACTDSNAENRPSMFEVVGWLKGGVGRRKTETSEVENIVDEEDEDNDTDYEEYRYKIERSNMRRTRV